MNWSLLFTFLLIFSCAHHDGPDRAPSSEAENIVYGDPDPAKSLVKEFPPEHEENFTRHYYYLQIRDQSGFVDRDSHEFEIRSGKRSLPLKVQRVLRGRYYLILEADKGLRTGQLDFFVAGVKLKESFRLGLRPADVKHSKLRPLKVMKTRATLELVLKDRKGRLVETPEPPEIVLDSGSMEIEKIEHMGTGNWQITLLYPRGNQLTYISVRSHGVYLKNLYRFQYIDKSHR